MTRRSQFVALVSVPMLAALVLPTTGSRPGPKFELRAEIVKARETGKRVEIVDARTETDTVWANPNGTFTRNYSATPVRAKTKSGWKPVDYDLAVTAKGRWRRRRLRTR